MKQNKSIFLLLILFFCILQSNAQNQYPQNYFASPLDIPLELSGSFGELRNNHFHSGIDLRTQEKEGFNVYAPANAYVSRIKVSTYGFGNALYITHPNGYVTVFGHLQSFNSKITAYLREMQYKMESYEVDLNVPRNKIKLTKGEIIAISGNSGNTEGPHLHFEIRDKKTEKTINPLLFGYKIIDTIPPIIESIKFYDLNSGIDYSLKINDKNGNYFTTDDTLFFPSVLTLGISTYDRMIKNVAKTGIYKMSIFLDTTEIFKITFNQFSFNESRYINAYLNYKNYIETGVKYQQTRILPGNKLSIYNFVKDYGIITLNDNDLHLIKIKISDYEENSSTISFIIKKEDDKNSTLQSKSIDSNALINHNLPDTLIANNLKIYFPPYSLYENLELNYKEIKNDRNYLSNIFQIHDNKVPIHKNISINIKADSIADSLQSKLLIVRIKEDGKFVSEGGKFSEGFVKANINIFGKFAVLIDTIAPIIKPMDFNQKPISVRKETIDFKISDNLSGIAKYSGELNGKWILMEYSGKNNILTYTIDEKLKKGENQLKITVEDGRQNKSEMNFIINK